MGEQDTVVQQQQDQGNAPFDPHAVAEKAGIPLNPPIINDASQQGATTALAGPQPMSAPAVAPPPAPAPQSAPGSFGDKFHAAISQATPELLSQTGGLMKALTVAAIDAMKPNAPTQAPGVQAGMNATRAFHNFFAPLPGKMGEVDRNAIAQMDERQKQQREQSEQQRKEQRENLQFGLNVAAQNMNMLHTQALLHEIQGRELDSAVTDGQKYIESMKGNPTGGKVIAQDLDEAEMSRLVNLHKDAVARKDPNADNIGLDPTKVTFVPSRKVTSMQRDEAGNPYSEIRYSAVSVPEQQKITSGEEFAKLFPERAAQMSKEALAGISADHPMTVTGDDYNGHYHGYQESQVLKAKNQDLQDDIEKKGLAHGDFQEFKAFKNQGQWAAAQQVIAQKNSQDEATAKKNGEDYQAPTVIQNTLSAYRWLEQNQPLTVTMPNGQKVQATAAEIRAHNPQNADTLLKTATPVYPNLMADVANSFPGGEKGFDSMLKEDENERAKMDLQEEKDRAKKEEKNAAMADISALVDQTLAYNIDPEKYRNMKTDERAAFQKAILARDPSWSEANYKNRYDMIREYSNTKAGAGAQKISLNTFTEHAAGAMELLNEVYNTKPELLNRGLNALRKQFGETRVGAYQAALEVVRDEYLNLIKANHAPTKEEIERGEELLNQNTVPSRAADIIKQMARTVIARGNSLNMNWYAVFGKNYPAMLSPQNAKTLQDMGMDLSRIGGVAGPVGQPEAPKIPTNQLPAQVPQDAQAVFHDQKDPSKILGYRDHNGKIVKF